MDRVASFDEDNSDSDYMMNVSSSSESSEENDFPTKRRNLQLTKRKDSLESAKNPLSKLNIKQSAIQGTSKLSLKRKFSLASNTLATTTTTISSTKNEGNSTINNFQIMSASQSPNDDNNSSATTTPTMELDLINNHPSILMPAPAGGQNNNNNLLSDEPPYFPEKFVGKLCAFCNLGERSQLGQGEMLRLEVTDEDMLLIADPASSSSTSIPSNNIDEEISNANNNVGNKNGSDDLSKMLKNAGATNLLQQQLNRRQKGLNKCKNPVNTTEYVDELEKIGHHEATEFNMLIDNGFYYVHRSCAMWSYGVDRDPVSDALSNVSQVLKQSLSRKCSFCNHYGASASCKVSTKSNCNRVYHFPCIAASGSFQVSQSCIIYCIDHLGQVPLNCKKFYLIIGNLLY